MFNRTFLVVLFLCVTTICKCENSTEADATSSTDGLTTVSSTVKPENTSCNAYNKLCDECVKHKCYYCQSDEKCNQAKGIFPLSEECSVDSTRYLTCTISFKIFLVLVGISVGIVFLIILCVCCYCCCKKKGIKVSKDEIKFARQREERKARAEERKKERASRTEEIRRKYGLMKDDNPYERFDA